MDQGPQQTRPQDNITIILHRPAIPENIGSVARAMKNTGFTRLIISCPETDDWSTAGNLAVSAADILDRAPRCGSLNEAVIRSGAKYIVGTTGRTRKYWNSEKITSAAQSILDHSLQGGTALLFGPENIGLTNEELTICHKIVSIPSEGELASYNLAQAVLLVLYTLMLQSPQVEKQEHRKSAAFNETEGMYEHIRDLLITVGFLLEDNPDHMMRAVRSFVNRAEPAEQEVRMIRGVCRKLLWHIKRP